MGKEKITKKEIMYEVGRDIGKVGERVYSSTFGPVFGYLNKDVKNVGKDVIKVACKATYPILGNMSNNVQTKLENLLGKEYYNAEHAFNTSVVSNLPLYVSPLFIGKILDDKPLAPFVTSSLLGLILFFAETKIRLDVSNDEGRSSETKICPSLFGKIASTPLELYDLGKNYLDDVKERVERR